MGWTAVVVAVRNEEQRVPMEEVMARLQTCKLFSHETEIIVVVDAAHNSGSAGSALNAVLVVTEHLCARRGLTVLDDDVLHSSSILVVLAGQPSADFPLGRAFAVLEGDEQDKTVGSPARCLPNCAFVRQLLCLERLGSDANRGVWVMSTESLWELEHYERLSVPSDRPTAFCCATDTTTASEHGTYCVDADNTVRSLSYRVPPSSCSEGACQLILGLLYFPPAPASEFLHLASTYPLSRATYHGLDSGTIGLKLSLFFDIIYATCSSFEAFRACRIAPEKTNVEHEELLEQSRATIHLKLSKYTTSVVSLNVASYEYLEDSRTLRFSLEPPWPHFLSRAREEVERVIREYGTKSARRSSISPILRALTSTHDRRQIEWLCRWVLERSSRKEQPVDMAVALTAIGSALWLWAGGRGGLRCGPAANEAFARHIHKLENDAEVAEGLAGLVDELLRGPWLDTPHASVRAARHLEAAAQIFTQQRVKRICQKFLTSRPSSALPGPRARSVTVELPARIDLFGGWLDTPPITFDTTAGVLNMAVLVDGKRPLACTVRVLDHSPDVLIEGGCRADRLRLSLQQVLDRHTKPHMEGALVCACLVGCGLLSRSTSSLEAALSSRGVRGTGLAVRLDSSLAHGSGLGSSSILASSCIIALLAVMGEEYDNDRVVHAVLYVEQLLTTGGGWQDQVGGLYPGLKLGRYDRDQERITVETVAVSPQLETAINERLLLVFTGQPRLAKNLLQEVVRSWLCSEGDQCAALMEMSWEIERANEWINGDSLPVAHIAQYFHVKKRLATGCEPARVTGIIQCLSVVSSLCWLVGAGGGGYLVVWLDEGRRADEAQAALDRNGYSNLRVQRVEVCLEPVTIVQSA